MKEILFRRRFNYLDAMVYCLGGAIIGDGDLFLGLVFLVAGHFVVSSLDAVFN